MLARSANSLFWMSRYLERAEHVTRLILVQFEALEDRTIDEIDQNWRRIYQSIGRSPLGGELRSNVDNEDYMLLDSFTLADDLTFEFANADSIRSSMYFARENAKQVRHLIGRQLWTGLNTAYINLKRSGIEQVWDKQPKEFFRNAENIARTLSGVVDSSVYRDDGWHFLQLGRYIERTQNVAALLEAQARVFSTDFKHSDSDWNSLLMICNSQLAYRRKYSLLSLNPNQVMDFLICDASLPNSIRYSLDRTLEHLLAVSADQDRTELIAINNQARAILGQIQRDWQCGEFEDSEICEILHNTLASSYELSNNVANAYFFY